MWGTRNPPHEEWGKCTMGQQTAVQSPQGDNGFLMLMAWKRPAGKEHEDWGGWAKLSAAGRGRSGWEDRWQGICEVLTTLVEIHYRAVWRQGDQGPGLRLRDQPGSSRNRKGAADCAKTPPSGGQLSAGPSAGPRVRSSRGRGQTEHTD